MRETFSIRTPPSGCGATSTPPAAHWSQRPRIRFEGNDTGHDHDRAEDQQRIGDEPLERAWLAQLLDARCIGFGELAVGNEPVEIKRHAARALG
jgi:hypothetical protein